MNELLQSLNENIERSVKRDASPFFTYIIGNNGTGKSRILAALANDHEWSAVSNVNSVLCITNGLYDRFQVTPGQKTIYLGARSVGNAIFHAAIDRQLAKFVCKGIYEKTSFLKRLCEALEIKLFYEITTSGRSSKMEGFESLVDKRKLRSIPINKILKATERKWIVEIQDKENPFSYLRKIDAEVLIRFLDLNPNIVVYVEKKDGLRYKFSHLSSGEQNRILLSAKILAHASSHDLIIIDEPEISLHLHWQRQFHSLLKSLLSKIKNYHVVIATHSPIIVSEAVKDVHADSIYVLESAAGDIADNEEQDQSFLDFRKIVPRELNSFDGLVLDVFDTVPDKTTSVNEEIAESILAISRDNNAPVRDSEKKKIKRILKKDGISALDQKTVAKALRLIDDHFL